MLGFLQNRGLISERHDLLNTGVGVVVAPSRTGPYLEMIITIGLFIAKEKFKRDICIICLAFSLVYPKDIC